MRCFSIRRRTQFRSLFPWYPALLGCLRRANSLDKTFITPNRGDGYLWMRSFFADVFVPNVGMGLDVTSKKVDAFA
jgi:hypothetical protein